MSNKRTPSIHALTSFWAGERARGAFGRGAAFFGFYVGYFFGFRRSLPAGQGIV